MDTSTLAAHLGVLTLGAQTFQGHLENEHNALSHHDESIRPELLYARAQLLMVQSWENLPCFPKLVSCVSLTLYQQAAGKSAAAWTTFGICVRQAQALGCVPLLAISDCVVHRDMPHRNLTNSMRGARRSTWLNLYTLDTLMSSFYGRPPIIVDEYCDAVCLSLSIY
jgi:Fungal specific transcription factor domain